MNNLNIAGVYRKRRITLWLAFSGLVFALPAPASEQEEELAPAPATKFSVQCGKEGSGSSNSTCKECTAIQIIRSQTGSLDAARARRRHFHTPCTRRGATCASPRRTLRRTWPRGAQRACGRARASLPRGRPAGCSLERHALTSARLRSVRLWLRAIHYTNASDAGAGSLQPTDACKHALQIVLPSVVTFRATWPACFATNHLLFRNQLHVTRDRI